MAQSLLTSGAGPPVNEVPRNPGIVTNSPTLKRLSRNAPLSAADEKVPRYQWFWAGTHEETKKLTPDLKHTVKRHVVVKRIVSLRDFPLDNDEHPVKKTTAVNPAREKRNATRTGGSTSTSPKDCMPAQVTAAGTEYELVGMDDLAGRNVDDLVEVYRKGNLHVMPVDHMRMALARCFNFDFRAEVCSSLLCTLIDFSSSPQDQGKTKTRAISPCVSP